MVKSFVIRRTLLPFSEADCHDVRVTGRALRTVLAAAATSKPGLCTVDVEDCGAAYRFLMPLLALTPGQWLLTGTPRLLQRPMAPLASALQGIGADIRRVENGWEVHGKQLRAEALDIDASLSSQMASALVLAAPLLGLHSLHLKSTDIPSLSYLRMTLACMKEFPVAVKGVALPETPAGAMGDWSAALFWFAYACLHRENKYVLSPLSLESLQPDSIIAVWFNELGLVISSENSNIVIRADAPSRAVRLSLDMRDNLDTVPVMAALAALLPADITFRNVGNLRYKESDRLQALVTQLSPFAGITLCDNVLHVVGKGRTAETLPEFDTFHDHRLAMAFLLFGPDARLSDTECLRKSYPGLLRDLFLVERGLAPEAQ